MNGSDLLFSMARVGSRRILHQPCFRFKSLKAVLLLSDDLKFVNAAAKADYRHPSGEHEIDDARGVQSRHRRHICAKNVIRLGDKTNVRQINGQYYHEEADRTLEHGHNRRESRQGKYADAAGDTETVIKVLVERRRIKNSNAHVNPTEIIKQNEQGGCVIVESWNDMSRRVYHTAILIPHRQNLNRKYIGFPPSKK